MLHNKVYWDDSLDAANRVISRMILFGENCKGYDRIMYVPVLSTRMEIMP